MVVAGRRRSIAFFIALGAGLISIIVLLYIGWVVLRWHNGILLFLGSLLAVVALCVTGAWYARDRGSAPGPLARI